MQLVRGKTVRFSELVKNSGRPEQITLWTEPEKSPGFWKAVQQNRVLTIIQRNVGSKKDYGLVGFFQQPQATFLVFPKELTQPAETKVVGIKYDLLQTPIPAGALYTPPPRRPPGVRNQEKSSSASPANNSHSKPAPSENIIKLPPPKRRYISTLQIIAKQSVQLEVEASSLAEAKRLLERAADETQIDLAEASIKRRVSRPRLHNNRNNHNHH